MITYDPPIKKQVWESLFYWLIWVLSKNQVHDLTIHSITITSDEIQIFSTNKNIAPITIKKWYTPNIWNTTEYTITIQ